MRETLPHKETPMNAKLATAKTRVASFVNNDVNIAATKTVVKLVARRTVSGVVVTLAHQNLNTTDFSKMQKASVYVGTYLIGAMVADAAADRVDNKINDLVEAVKEIVNDEEETESTETETTVTESTDQ
jgi:hypothetical protein